ncbi:urease subunit beta [Providencia rettgeri]|nr:urease subunit beta [Providencia rettgeri]
MSNSKADIKVPTPLGGVIFADEPIEFNVGKPETKIKVRNTVTDQCKLVPTSIFEVNHALEFDRAAAYGKRLNIASTTAIRFEPGDEVEVSLIPYGGKQSVYGFNNLVDGWAGDNVAATERPAKAIALNKAIARGFKHKEQ